MSNLLGHVQKLVQVDTSVGELPEGTLLFDFSIRLEQITIVTGQYTDTHVPVTTKRGYLQPHCFNVSAQLLGTTNNIGLIVLNCQFRPR